MRTGKLFFLILLALLSRLVEQLDKLCQNYVYFNSYEKKVR